MKFFSLMRGGEIHLAPEARIVPAAELAELLSGKELMEKVQKEALEFKEAVAKECTLLQEQADAKGFEAGLQRWTAQIAQIEAYKEQLRQEVEQMIAPVALKAAKKIVAKEMELHPDTIVDIVRQALKAVSLHRRFVIYANKQDVAILETNKQKLKDVLESVETMTIQVRDDVQQGDSVIETEAGIINVKIAELWDALEAAFKNLIRS